MNFWLRPCYLPTYSKAEMCGNGFLHSHSLPFPCNQFPFLPIPISSSVTIPIPIQFAWTYSHSHSISHAVDRNITNLLAIYVKKNSKPETDRNCDDVTKSRNAQTYARQVRTTGNVVAPYVISTHKPSIAILYNNLQQPLMGINSHGNGGHSHSHFHVLVNSCPILMGLPWDSHSHWDSQSHAHL